MIIIQTLTDLSLAGSVSSTNINLMLKVQGKDGLIARENSQLFNISGGSFKSINQSITLSDNDDFLHVYVDINNKVTESNEKNNYALVPLFKPEINAYLSINTGYTSIDNEIKKFLKLYVNEVASQSQADVTIAVGLPNKNSIINSKNSFTKKNYGWWFDNRIYFNNNPLGTKPYNGLVGAFRDDYNYIFVGGNDIDGLLAALKRLISARSLFFSELKKDKVKVIEDMDVAGISVADLLRNPSNKPYYNQRGSDAFANVVSRILNNNNFEITIKTVKTYNDNTTLRLKSVNTDFSSNYKDAVVRNSKPVVLARGLWSNLLTWNKFGQELAFDKDNARDTWLIELTGGDTTECSTCPNYKYEDLVDFYWPALITEVQNYSAQKTLDYVGFSNGCRVALDSLKNWSSSGKNNSGYVFDSVTGLYISSNLGGNPVDTFVGVGCPGAFNDKSSLAVELTNRGTTISNRLKNKNLNHISINDITNVISLEMGCAEILSWFLSGDSKISANLFDKYVDLMKNSSDKQPASGLNLSRFAIIGGTQGFRHCLIPSLRNDRVVSVNDSTEIYNNIQTTDKKYRFEIYHHHQEIADKGSTLDIVKRILNNQSLTWWQQNINLKESS